MGSTKTLALGPRSLFGALSRVTLAAMPGPAGSLDFEVVTSRQDLARLEPEWNALWARTLGSSSPFLSFNWLWHWCQHYLDAPSSRLAIVTGRRNGRLILVWPLCIEHQFRLRTASFAGAPVSQYGDILIDQDQPGHGGWVAEAWLHIHTRLALDIIHLRKVRADSPIAAVLRRAGSKETNQQSAPFVALAGEACFEDFETRYNAKDRKNRRRKRKRLGELGRLGFRRAETAHEIESAFGQAMCWKRNWLKDEALVSAALADSRFDRFFKSVLTSADRPAGGELFELTLDERPVAIMVAVTAGHCRAMHLTAYDRALEKCGPGGVLIEEMIATSLAGGITTLDFLAPAHDYKKEWASGEVLVSDFSLAISPAGRFYDEIYLQRLRPRLQRLLTEGPTPVRRGAAVLSRIIGQRMARTPTI